MKKLISKHALVAIAAGGMLFSSCGDHDMFNPNYKKNEYAANWETKFGKIDPAQDWSMATTVKATMSIYEDALADYKLQLYSANPIDNENAKLIADYKVTTDARGNVSVSFNVDIVKGTKEVYAARMDSHNRRIYKVANITEEGINVSFGTTTRTYAPTRAANNNSDNQYVIPAFQSPYPTAADVDNEINNGGYTKRTNFDGFWSQGEECVAFEISENMNIQNTYAFQRAKKVLIVVKSGAVLTFPSSGANNWASWAQEKYDIIIENGGELKMDMPNSDCGLGFARLIVQRGGKVTGKRLSTGYPQNNVVTDGIWNDGTIELEWLNMAKSNIYNNGVMKINTFDTSNGGRITNNGRVECETFGATSDQSGEIWTNCLFRCKDYMKGSNFRIGANAALEAKVVEIYGNLDLNKNAILRASESGIIGNCTINAPSASGNDFALVVMPTLYYYDNNEHTTGAITGNLYLEYNEFDRSKSEAEYWAGVLANYMATNAGAICKVGEAPLVIAGSDAADIENADCSGRGNTPDNKQPQTPKYQSWILACEDLGSTDDYDFNDIVLEVMKNASNNAVEIRCLAAGGTLPAYITCNGVEIGEAHALLGGQTNQMINTNSFGAASEWQTLTGVNVDMSIDEIIKNISIRVTQNEGDVYAKEIKAPETGEAPQMIIVPGDWEWPAERKGIETAYPDFTNWSSNASLTDWNSVKVSDKVVKR